MTELLAISNLEKRFPVHGAGGWGFGGGAPSQVFAVDGVNFTIARGETVGLVGESGCGKSTLVRLIARLLDPNAGEIRFDGTDLAAIPARRFGRTPHRAEIQMVFQDPTDSLNPRFTAMDAIADPLRRLKPMSALALKERVRDCAHLCGLSDDLLSRFPHQLSGGQKARVGIARALAVEPRLLILDEPTSALDVSVQVLVLHVLEELKARLGLTYLFVSHDLNVVRLLCNRVLVMYSGKIVESGTTSQIFNAPQHPYTSVLLSAIPNFANGESRKRIVLTGEPTSPIDPDPRTCRFYGRCWRGAQLCHESMPNLLPFDAGHDVACHFPASTLDAPETLHPAQDKTA
jgi:oligopeptide/dipeptide ABC transporter ATP-binding protein